MSNLNWDRLNHHQLGKYAEYLACMEFLSYGIDTYPTTVDDHGVDLVIKDKNGRFCEIQVKSLFRASYTYILKRHLNVENPNYYVFFLHFKNESAPTAYLIPATAWKNPEGALVSRDYDKVGQKSQPEYGISLSRKTIDSLEKYKFERVVQEQLL